ncbi:MAG: VOC family protein [Lysobacteraceae bacterium]
MGLALDHFVLTVASIEATVAFYRETVGATHVVFGAGRHALAFGAQKVNLHQAGRELMPRALRPTPGAGDFCLLTDEPLAAVAARLATLGIPVEEGPVARTGAQGPLLSLYVRDPDGNLVEVANLA